MSYSDNVCIFSNSGEMYQDLFAFQFIYETAAHRLGDNRSYLAFCCHLVTEGEAVLHTAKGSWTLTEGDLFFIYPSLAFTLEQKSTFKYLYIAFVGKHSFHLLETVGISSDAPVRHGFSDLRQIWFSGFQRCNTENVAFMAKSILYYTFALLMQSSATLPTGDTDDSTGIVTRIRDAIEQDYTKTDLSLEYLCALHHYNTKYISRKFTEIMGVTFSEYLTACRIRHACPLLSDTNMSIRDVAASVGYRDALYFSKVFKKTMKATPSEYRSSLTQF